jgi:MFS family permease
VVPILPYMLETRLKQDPDLTQRTTSGLLSVHGFATLILTPLVAIAADRTPSRKTPLIIALIVCLGGTILVALTPDCKSEHPHRLEGLHSNPHIVWSIYVGRILQGVSGSAAWIICLAMLTDCAKEGQVGRMMGLSMSIVLSGTVGGPTVAGALLQWAGYWPAWSVPIGLILINIVARVVTKDLPKPSATSAPPRGGISTDEQDLSTRDVETAETSPLLSQLVNAHDTTCEDKDDHQDAEVSFYYEMLGDCRVLASISTTTLYSILIAGFNTTLPVHLRTIFNWGPSNVGTMFLVLRVPAIILGPLMGWTRDYIGLRYPTTVGWALLAPLMLCLAIPTGPENHGKAFYVTCLTCIGFVTTLVQGAGVLHTISKHSTTLDHFYFPFCTLSY